jgi:hypothetical protein
VACKYVLTVFFSFEDLYINLREKAVVCSQNLMIIPPPPLPTHILLEKVSGVCNVKFSRSVVLFF